MISKELAYAVRPRVPARYFGQMCVVLAALTVPPTVVSLLTDPWPVSRRYLGVLFGLGAVAAVGATMHLLGERGWTDALRHALILGMSAQSTAGLSSLDVGLLDPASKLVLVPTMLVGGSLGSTAGGFKLLRLLVLVRVLHLIVSRTALPRHGVSKPSIAGRRIPASEVREALSVIVLYGAVVLGSSLAFVAAGHGMLDSLFEVASATGTVGLSTGLTSSELETPLKAVLCADMLLGRLEIVA